MRPIPQTMPHDMVFPAFTGSASGMRSISSTRGRPAAWALMASPLFFGGDMGRLDEFTVDVLCNAEVIDVDQDRLGKQVIRKPNDERWDRTACHC
jgi:hypothetical protein